MQILDFGAPATQSKICTLKTASIRGIISGMARQPANPPGKRHTLLLYTRLYGMLRWPALLIAGLCGGLWWFAPGVPMLASNLAQACLFIIAGVCGLLFVYAWLGPRFAYVQCHPKYLRVSTPLFRVAISYNRIRTTRPVKFTPGQLPFTQGRMVDPFRGHTILGLELMSYPLSESTLKRMFTPFMFSDSFKGLQFVVTDWMGLAREIDSYRDNWKIRSHP
jgi:hypothetical protein